MIWGIAEETECVLHGKRKPQETVITGFKIFKDLYVRGGKDVLSGGRTKTTGGGRAGVGERELNFLELP